MIDQPVQPEVNTTPRSTKLIVAATSAVLGLILVTAVGYGLFQFVWGGKLPSLPFLNQPSFKCPENPDQYLTYISLKEALRKPDQICKLDLGGQKLTQFPPEIIQLKNLHRLFLNGNNLTDIPDDIVTMKNLEVLDFSDNQLTTIPTGVLHMTWLTQLSLSNNPIKSLPPGLFGLTNLTQLYLNGDTLSEIPPGIGFLTKLELLYLNKTKLKSLPDEIGNLKVLKSLYLKGSLLSGPDKERLKGLLPNTQIYFQ